MKIKSLHIVGCLFFVSLSLHAQDSSSAGALKDFVIFNISSIETKIDEKKIQLSKNCQSCFENSAEKEKQLKDLNSYKSNLSLISKYLQNKSSVEDIEDMEDMEKYFSDAEKTLVKSEQKHSYDSVLYNLSADLNFKLKKNTSDDSQLISIFKPTVEVNVTAMIGLNEIPKNRFRLYYSKLLYDDIVKNTKIEYNDDIHSSDNLETPYKFKISFTPKLIFWLTDIQTNEIYLPDSIREISQNPSNFTISFKKH